MKPSERIEEIKYEIQSRDFGDTNLRGYTLSEYAILRYLDEQWEKQCHHHDDAMCTNCNPSIAKSL